MGYTGVEHWDPWARAGLQSRPRLDEWLSLADVVNRLACWDGPWREGFNARWGVHEGEPVEAIENWVVGYFMPTREKLAAEDPDAPADWPDHGHFGEDMGEFRWLKDMMFSVLKQGADFCTSPWAGRGAAVPGAWVPRRRAGGRPGGAERGPAGRMAGETLELGARLAAAEAGDEAPAVTNRIF